MTASSQKRKLLKLLEVCVAALVVSFMAALLIPKLSDGYTHQPFDAIQWRQTLHHASHDRHSVRQRMAKDLIQSNRLLGLRRSEVEQLLGPPGDDPHSISDSLRYSLGNYRDSADTEWLVITFGVDGRASDVTRFH